MKTSDRLPPIDLPPIDLPPIDLPPLDARYWTALLAASLLGTASGDFAADILGLGFVGGTAAFAAVVGAVAGGLALPRARGRMPAGAGYWAAIVATRGGATNIADLLTHRLDWSYAATAAGLSVLLVAAAAATRRRDGAPRPDARYWVAVMLAGLVGTVAGDGISGAIGLRAALIVTGGVAAAAMAWQIAARPRRRADYWAALLAVRVAGTIGADYLADPGLANSGGLGLTLWGSLAATAGLFALVLTLPGGRRMAKA